MPVINSKPGRPSKRQPYCDQSGGQKRDTMKQFSDFLQDKAGGDYESIFRDYLSKQERKEGERQKSMRLLNLLKGWAPMKTLIKGLKTTCERLPTYEWREVISIVINAGFTRKMMTNLGWRIGAAGTSDSAGSSRKTFMKLNSIYYV